MAPPSNKQPPPSLLSAPSAAVAKPNSQLELEKLLDGNKKPKKRPKLAHSSRTTAPSLTNAAVVVPTLHVLPGPQLAFPSGLGRIPTLSSGKSVDADELGLSNASTFKKAAIHRKSGLASTSMRSKEEKETASTSLEKVRGPAKLPSGGTKIVVASAIPSGPTKTLWDVSSTANTERHAPAGWKESTGFSNHYKQSRPLNFASKSAGASLWAAKPAGGANRYQQSVPDIALQVETSQGDALSDIDSRNSNTIKTAALPSPKTQARRVTLEQAASNFDDGEHMQAPRLLPPKPVVVATQLPRSLSSSSVPLSRAPREFFVKQNLLNQAGSCAGARNKRPKSKAQLQRQERYAEYQQRKSTVHFNLAGTLPVPLVSGQNGIDPLDDYIDGTFSCDHKASGTKRKRSFAGAQPLPLCSGHQQPCKLLTVKKKGSVNKGRQFYACALPREDQCTHFQWADDTMEAARTALGKSDYSSFVQRQVNAYMEHLRDLTVPELRTFAHQHGLDGHGKRAQLMMRLTIWVRDEIVAGTQDVAASVDESAAETSKLARVPIGSPAISEQDSDDDNATTSDSSASEELELVCDHRGETVLTTSTKSGPGLTTNDATQELQRSLFENFGHSGFRQGQEWAVRRCLEGQRSLLVAPTGFGKSLCYALPAAIMDGVCIVVSPLVSLMQDQLRLLPPRIPSTTLSGQLSAAKLASTIDDIVRGRIKIVFVSPERLTSASFRRMFRMRWNVETQRHERQFPVVSLLCVDECHCLSQWGHNFRPSYLRMKSALKLVAPKSVLAITATAGPRVVSDVCVSLGINSASSELEDNVKVLPTERNNLDVKFALVSSHEQRLAKLLSILKPSTESSKENMHKNADLHSGPVIVYVWRQMDADTVAEYIQAAGVAGGVVVYHGGMDASARSKAQSKFMRGKARVCVATVAFGLGINHEGIRGIVHMCLPASPEHYVQEIGRAGRDGRNATAIALVIIDEVLVRHSLAHSDWIALSQIIRALEMMETLTRCVISTPSVSEPFVAIPLSATSSACDCKPATLETLIALLEDLGVLVTEGVSYDKVTVAPKRRAMSELAQTEKLAGAIVQAGTCVEHPAGSGIHHRFDEKAKLAGSYGCYAISIATCATILSLEPRHVFGGLRRLQSRGDLDYIVDTSEAGRVISVRLTQQGVQLLTSPDNAVGRQDLANKIHQQFCKTVRGSAAKVLDMHTICRRVSAAHDTTPRADGVKNPQEIAGPGCRSDSLSVFQSLLKSYFSDKAMADETTVDMGVFDSLEPTKHILAGDARSALSHLMDVQNAAGEALPIINFKDPVNWDYTALAVTKFLHGIMMYNVAPQFCRQHPLFGRMQRVPFQSLHETIADLFRPKVVEME